MLLYGADSFAKVVKECAKASGREVYFIFDDFKRDLQLDNTPVVGPYNKEFNVNEPILIGVEENLLRKTLVSKIEHAFTSVIHPQAIISKYVSYLDGTIIFQGAIIQAGTTIGKHCIINIGAKIDFECLISDYVNLGPGSIIGGYAKIEEGVTVGAGAIVSPNIEIGKWAVISPGSVVTENVPEYTVVEGIPAKVVKSLVKTI
ncbi:MAG: NeuD/PglB/VioB family sugar acetyltransferase [Sporocytophaga sp.]|jgi:sugar O-acyltransferase (sialic acid O-acetyltransferase NeuD family)|nr:NeuD/PglB/VioB family sugar acetyltransferase [Sporocytophaga sp.]